MRQGPNNRRPRSRHHSGGGNGGGGGGHSNHGNHSSSGNSGGMGGNRPRSAASLRHQSFDSNCGDLRVRGNAWQVLEKYQALARDAASSGDRVTAENFLQHAEHYCRIIQAINEATAAEQRLRGEPVTAFGSQQPEMPTNYYGSGPAPVTTNAEGQQPPAQQSQAEATVQNVNQPQPSAFFTQEEIDEHKNDQSLAAAR